MNIYLLGLVRWSYMLWFELLRTHMLICSIIAITVCLSWIWENMCLHVLFQLFIYVLSDDTWIGKGWIANRLNERNQNIIIFHLMNQFCIGLTRVTVLASNLFWKLVRLQHGRVSLTRVAVLPTGASLIL